MWARKIWGTRAFKPGGSLPPCFRKYQGAQIVKEERAKTREANPLEFKLWSSAANAAARENCSKENVAGSVMDWGRYGCLRPGDGARWQLDRSRATPQACFSFIGRDAIATSSRFCAWVGSAVPENMPNSISGAGGRPASVTVTNLLL
jgi:hypothetical protein